MDSEAEKSAMDNALTKLLERAEKQHQPDSPMPLLDAAFAINKDDTLSYAEKQQKIEALEKQAKGLEKDYFGDVWENLMVRTPFDEIVAADGELD
tara:strand:- start:7201 stop:7485 length:285 start_codon:yes stop_codon:yes gene_type:complete